MTPGAGRESELQERKRWLRREIRGKSDALTAAYREEASRRIAEQVLAAECFRRARVIMAYASLPNEPDTRGMIREAIREGKTVLLPRCVSPEEMVALPFDGWEDLEPGYLGVMEPRFPAEGLEIPEPELILVPCMAASRDGRRLGHGAGYYDRFLEKRKAETLCLCFRELIRDDIPAGPLDRRVDRVITD